jgi:hypothetical protein
MPVEEEIVQKVTFTSSPDGGSSIIVILKLTDNRFGRQYIFHENTVRHFRHSEITVIAWKVLVNIISK